MIEGVRKYLSEFGDFNKRILEALDVVDRAIFYPFGEKSYEDTCQSIEEGVKESQPSCVGRMLDLLDLKKNQSVLVVCANSGWVPSLISYLVKPGKVLAIDIHDELIEVAIKHSARFGLDKNLHIENQDFFDLVQKFDRIIFNCGILRDDEKKISKWVFEHLNDSGKAVIPFDEGPLILLEKIGEKNKKDYTDERYLFEPLYR